VLVKDDKQQGLVSEYRSGIIGFFVHIPPSEPLFEGPEMVSFVSPC
jgi:hypothetical protein